MKVFIIAAVTADGFIGRTSDHGADWTGKSDKKIFVELTKKAGTIIMGARTFATIGRALPGRRNIVYTSDPDSIKVRGVETTNEPPRKLLKRLKSEGVTSVAICGGASIYNLFMQAKLVNELYLTVVPILFGQGINLFSETLDQKLSIKNAAQISDGNIVLHYDVLA